MANNSKVEKICPVKKYSEKPKADSPKQPSKFDYLLNKKMAEIRKKNV